MEGSGGLREASSDGGGVMFHAIRLSCPTRRPDIPNCPGTCDTAFYDPATKEKTERTKFKLSIMRMYLIRL